MSAAWLLIPFFFFLLDRSIKWVIEYRVPAASWEFFYTLVAVGFFPNEKTFFGLPFSSVLFQTFWWIFFVAVFFWFAASAFRQTPAMLPLAFVIVGAFSNAIDRFAYGYVIDYVRLGTLWYNGADCLILLGVLLYVCQSIFRRTPRT